MVFFMAACSGGGGGGGFIAPQQTGSVSLSWTAPTQYTDGTPLVPAGYKIHYGTRSGVYTNTITVADAAAITYTVKGLPLGHTYYFIVTSLTSTGVESAPSSPEVSKKL